MDVGENSHLLPIPTIRPWHEVPSEVEALAWEVNKLEPSFWEVNMPTCSPIQQSTVSISSGEYQDSEISFVAHLRTITSPHVSDRATPESSFLAEYSARFLAYPLASSNLAEYMQTTSRDLEDVAMPRSGWPSNILVAFGCVISAVHYLKMKKSVKHKDIKPESILIHRHGYVLPADFEISRQYPSETESTGGPTLYTRQYEAPELVAQQKRGFWDDNRVDGWTTTKCMVCSSLKPQMKHLEIIESMMSNNPSKRPSVAQLYEDFRAFSEDCVECKVQVRFILA